MEHILPGIGNSGKMPCSITTTALQYPAGLYKTCRAALEMQLGWKYCGERRDHVGHGELYGFTETREGNVRLSALQESRPKLVTQLQFIRVKWS